MRIVAPKGPVTAAPELPSSKSLSNRGLIIRFLSGKNFSIQGLSESGDTKTLQHLTENLSHEVNANDAGTAYRFLAAALAVTPGQWLLYGTDRLMERPIRGLVDALLSLGANIRYAEKEERGPLLITGKKLAGGSITVDARASSQFVSALLMIAPILENGLTLQYKGNASLPYIDMTLGMMEHFGVRNQRSGNSISIARQSYRAMDYVVEKDWSAASYWLEVAALSLNSEILLKELSPKSLQGDSAVVELMKPFGVTCRSSAEGVVVTSQENKGNVQAYEADCRNHPDLAPALISAAAGSGRTAKFTGLESLDDKESKRQQVLAGELSAHGIQIRSEKGILELGGGHLRPPALFKVHNDHRMAMCFAPLSLVTGEVEIDQPDAVIKSYPGYWQEMTRAGFVIR